MAGGSELDELTHELTHELSRKPAAEHPPAGDPPDAPDPETRA